MLYAFATTVMLDLELKTLASIKVDIQQIQNLASISKTFNERNPQYTNNMMAIRNKYYENHNGPNTSNANLDAANLDDNAASMFRRVPWYAEAQRYQRRASPVNALGMQSTPEEILPQPDEAIGGRQDEWQGASWPFVAVIASLACLTSLIN